MDVAGMWPALVTTEDSTRRLRAETSSPSLAVAVPFWMMALTSWLNTPTATPTPAALLLGSSVR